MAGLSWPDRPEDVRPQLQAVVHLDRHIPFDDHVVGDLDLIC
jgi:hypothetical protein